MVWRLCTFIHKKAIKVSIKLGFDWLVLVSSNQGFAQWGVSSRTGLIVGVGWGTCCWSMSCWPSCCTTGSLGAHDLSRWLCVPRVSSTRICAPTISNCVHTRLFLVNQCNPQALHFVRLQAIVIPSDNTVEHKFIYNNQLSDIIVCRSIYWKIHDLNCVTTKSSLMSKVSRPSCLKKKTVGRGCTDLDLTLSQKM